MSKITVRCRENGFTTSIPIPEWEAHDASFRAGWDVLTQGYVDPVVASPDEAEAV